MRLSAKALEETVSTAGFAVCMCDEFLNLTNWLIYLFEMLIGFSAIYCQND